jgi:hypothetical protein
MYNGTYVCDGLSSLARPRNHLELEIQGNHVQRDAHRVRVRGVYDLQPSNQIHLIDRFGAQHHNTLEAQA